MPLFPWLVFGTRLLPATKSQPKEMLPGRQEADRSVHRRGAEPLRNGPVSVRDRSRQEFDRGSLRYRRRSDPVRFARGGKEDLLSELEFERLGAHYFYTRQHQQRGLGDAISYAENFSGTEPFVVALGDSIIGRHEPSRILERLIDAFE
jgi:UTP--glucose-1-phosphate uridylyltransferase